MAKDYDVAFEVGKLADYVDEVELEDDELDAAIKETRRLLRNLNDQLEEDDDEGDEDDYEDDYEDEDEGEEEVAT